MTVSVVPGKLDVVVELIEANVAFTADTKYRLPSARYANVPFTENVALPDIRKLTVVVMPVQPGSCGYSVVPAAVFTSSVNAVPIGSPVSLICTGNVCDASEPAAVNVIGTGLKSGGVTVPGELPIHHPPVFGSG